MCDNDWKKKTIKTEDDGITKAENASSEKPFHALVQLTISGTLKTVQSSKRRQFWISNGLSIHIHSYIFWLSLVGCQLSIVTTIQKVVLKQKVEKTVATILIKFSFSAVCLKDKITNKKCWRGKKHKKKFHSNVTLTHGGCDSTKWRLCISFVCIFSLSGRRKFFQD